MILKPKKKTIIMGLMGVYSNCHGHKNNQDYKILYPKPK